AGHVERALVRSATNATSGAVSRASEIAYDSGTGADKRSIGEKIEDVRSAAVQNAVQGALEHGGEAVGEHYRQRAAALHADATKPAPTARPALPEPAAISAPASGHPPGLPEVPAPA